MKSGDASLRFDLEAERAVRPIPVPQWLKRGLRLRVYLTGLAALAASGLAGWGGPLWAAAFAGWCALHYLAHRAVHRERHVHEIGLLRKISGAGQDPVAWFYRREKKEAGAIANPLPNLEAGFGERLVANAEPSHHMRKRHARRWLRKFSRPSLRAGDVGCLAGEVSVEHVLAGNTVYLFDLDSISLARAAEKTGRPAIQADAMNLPVREGAFDLITFLEVIEHTADPAAVMREIAGVMAPGGRLLASTDNSGCLLPFHLLNPLIFLERMGGVFFPAVLPPRNLVKEDRSTGKIYPHASFDSAQIRSLVEGAGLELLWLKSYYFFPGFHRLVSRIFPGCTEEDYVRFALPVEVALQSIPGLCRVGTHWFFACEKPRSDSSGN